MQALSYESLRSVLVITWHILVHLCYKNHSSRIYYCIFFGFSAKICPRLRMWEIWKLLKFCCFLDLGTCVDMSHHRSSTQTAVVRNNKWLGYSPHCLFTLGGQDKARWDSSRRLWNTNDIRWSDYERLHWNGQISLCDHIFPLPWKWFSLARSKW